MPNRIHLCLVLIAAAALFAGCSGAADKPATDRARTSGNACCPGHADTTNQHQPATPAVDTADATTAAPATETQPVEQPPVNETAPAATAPTATDQPKETAVTETPDTPAPQANPRVKMETSKGTMIIELYADKAPITVKNFLAYVDSGFYTNTIFHRVIADFMLQGGGFTQDMNQKATLPPIKNEAKNGLKNERGTLSMARTNVVDSATSQFFVNLKHNDFLDHGVRDYGYAVFGKVVEGMDVVDAIGKVRTRTVGFYQDVPAEPVIIKSVTRVEPAKE